MENLKIKVNNEDESKEAQELFFELGYKIGACSLGGYPATIITTIVIGGDWVSTRSIKNNHPDHAEYKQITLPELRKLAGRESLNDQYAEIEKVRQSMQKEYLVKTEDGEYHFIPKGQKVGPTGELIEIPEGADAYIQYKSGDYKLFIKFGCPSQYWGDCRWCNVAKGYETLQSFIDDGDKIFWKRDAGLSDGDCVKPTAELSGSVDIKFDWGADSTLGPELNQSDINYRAAKAFNEIKQENTLTEDDVYLVLKLVELAKVHG